MKPNFVEVLSRLFVDRYNCIVCDRELPAPTPHRTCNSCYAKMEIIEDGFCLKCGVKLFGEEEYCLDCQDHEKHFDRAVSPVCYSGAAAKLVQELKFHNKRYLAKPLARYMTDRFLAENIPVDVIVPVPLSAQRRKERGYNQSELLAAEISRSLGVPMAADIAIRVKDTLPSTQLEGGRKAREENIRGAFVLKENGAVKNRVVLAVDDVLTTGATSSEFARILKKAGAAKVYVLTFATTREKPPIQREPAEKSNLV